MRLHLGGHLSWFDAQKRGWIEPHLVTPTALVVLLEQLGVPPAEVAIVALNGRLAELTTAVVTDGDTVELYPAIGGGALNL